MDDGDEFENENDAPNYYSLDLLKPTSSSQALLESKAQPMTSVELQREFALRDERQAMDHSTAPYKVMLTCTQGYKGDDSTAVGGEDWSSFRRLYKIPLPAVNATVKDLKGRLY